MLPASMKLSTRVLSLIKTSCKKIKQSPVQQKSYTNVTISQLRSSCNAKKQKIGQIFCTQEHCPAAAGAFYKRINRRLTQVQEMQNAPNIYCANA